MWFIQQSLWFSQFAWIIYSDSINQCALTTYCVPGTGCKGDHKSTLFLVNRHTEVNVLHQSGWVWKGLPLIQEWGWAWDSLGFVLGTDYANSHMHFPRIEWIQSHTWGGSRVRIRPMVGPVPKPMVLFLFYDSILPTLREAGNNELFHIGYLSQSCKPYFKVSFPEDWCRPWKSGWLPRPATRKRKDRS